VRTLFVPAQYIAVPLCPVHNRRRHPWGDRWQHDQRQLLEEEAHGGVQGGSARSLAKGGQLRGLGRGYRQAQTGGRFRDADSAFRVRFDHVTSHSGGLQRRRSAGPTRSRGRDQQRAGFGPRLSQDRSRRRRHDRTAAGSGHRTTFRGAREERERRKRSVNRSPAKRRDARRRPCPKRRLGLRASALAERLERRQLGEYRERCVAAGRSNPNCPDFGHCWHT